MKSACETERVNDQHEHARTSRHGWCDSWWGGQERGGHTALDHILVTVVVIWSCGRERQAIEQGVLSEALA